MPSWNKITWCVLMNYDITLPFSISLILFPWGSFSYTLENTPQNAKSAKWPTFVQKNLKGWIIFLIKASAHSFKQFTSRLLKLSFSLSLHIYNSHGRHAWFHLHRASRPARSTSEATKYKMKNSLSTVGLEPTTLWFQVWCSTDWASRAWWMLSI